MSARDDAQRSVRARVHIQSLQVEAEGDGVSAGLAALGAFVDRGMKAQAAVDAAIAAIAATTPAAPPRQLLIPNTPPPPPPAPRGARRRRPARFKVEAGFGRRFDGAPSAVVTISADLVTVRPHGRRRVYELPLAEVARAVIFDVTRVELAQKQKRARRGPR